MLKAIAIDDEPIALQVIKKHAAGIPYIQLEKVFTRASGALQYLQTEKVDLLFLDIKMPGLSGIDVLKSITDPPMVIFTTAYTEHAVQSFELNAIDYLLKPFSPERFTQACQKAKEQFELRTSFDKLLGGPPAVYIKSGYDQIKILLEDILYIEASGSYVQFVTPDKKILSRTGMNEAEVLLPKVGFVRIHRSYIIAIRHISKADKAMVWIGENSFPVSASFAAGLRAAMLK
jgi:two-component system LytT family response regulator